MELIIQKKGFFLIGKASEIITYLREQSKVYTTGKELINLEIH